MIRSVARFSTSMWSTRLLLLTLLAVAGERTLLAQAVSPWEQTVTALADAFTGPIAMGLSLVAIVLGGFTLAYGEGTGKRALGGLFFGVSMALSATRFVTWLFRS